MKASEARKLANEFISGQSEAAKAAYPEVVAAIVIKATAGRSSAVFRVRHFAGDAITEAVMNLLWLDGYRVNLCPDQIEGDFLHIRW